MLTRATESISPQQHSDAQLINVERTFTAQCTCRLPTHLLYLMATSTRRVGLSVNLSPTTHYSAGAQGLGISTRRNALDQLQGAASSQGTIPLRRPQQRHPSPSTGHRSRCAKIVSKTPKARASTCQHRCAFRCQKTSKSTNVRFQQCCAAK